MNKINMENTTNCFTLSTFDNDTIKVKVKFECVEKNNCYYISFSYTFPSELSTNTERIIFMKSLNLYDRTIDDYYVGDIIRKNPMTKELIKLMMLNDENLKTHSGNVTSECYRLSLIGTIQLLWD
tara:strand:- start:28 stop:402 length:375 start_codon:yes stop_codon:yes gene_type:complete